MTIPLHGGAPDRACDRRRWFGMALALPFATGMPGPSTPEPPRRAGRLSLRAVLEGAAKLCAEHLDDRKNDDEDEAWVHGATALLARLDAIPPDPFGAMTDRERGFLEAHSWTFRRVLAEPADLRRPAVITHQILIEPGGSIPLHDHRDLFGAVVCVEGDVQIRSFDIVEGGREDATVTLRESVRCWLAPGRYSLLTRARDNVHEFRAGPRGARILDLFVWLRDGAKSHELDWIDDPTGDGRGDHRYRARWQ